MKNILACNCSEGVIYYTITNRRLLIIKNRNADGTQTVNCTVHFEGGEKAQISMQSELLICEDQRDFKTASSERLAKLREQKQKEKSDG